MHSLTARQPMDYTHTVLRLIIYLYTLDLAATAAAVHHSELAALMIYSMLKEYVYMYVQLVLIYIYIYIYISQRVTHLRAWQAQYAPVQCGHFKYAVSESISQ
jgi:hypothetical protein